MSDKITKTVTYEIERYGNCWNCECLTELKQYKNSHICIAFNEEINNCEQCRACKEYLSQEKAKVYCDGCKNYYYDFYGNVKDNCLKNNKIIGHIYNKYVYSLNCIDREE